MRGASLIQGSVDRGVLVPSAAPDPPGDLRWTGRLHETTQLRSGVNYKRSSRSVRRSVSLTLCDFGCTLRAPRTSGSVPVPDLSLTTSKAQYAPFL
ncbi:hypothetical protein NDU88_003524 [Pleurodeles waltl]|uniref:Uncharacterized protein n=1 Tax=Pleurodeles waltl TaxID=8319 RepID=A0AAV7TRI1_PLEWA|nr:hypothetical protein NDU88_003524 [Pleurodeles waltl]